MPRAKKDDSAAEPKKRSRTGCWPCKARKIKCGEEHPTCVNCAKNGETCDYSIRLNWSGRSKRDKDGGVNGGFTFVSDSPERHSPGDGHGGQHAHEHVFSAQHITAAAVAPVVNSRPASSNRTSRVSTPAMSPRSPTGSSPSATDQHDSRGASSTFSGPMPPYLPNYGGFLPQSQAAVERNTAAPTSAPVDDHFFSWSPQHRAKRVRLSRPSSPMASPALPAAPIPSGGGHMPTFAFPQYSPRMPTVPSPGSTSFQATPHTINSVVHTPNTPNSSIYSNNSPVVPANVLSMNGGSGSVAGSLTVQEPPNLRRLSVQSLLGDYGEPEDESSRPIPVIPPPAAPHARTSGSRTYGYDHGFPDLDIPRNDDNAVMLPRSPDLRRASIAYSEVSAHGHNDIENQMAFAPKGYYAEPVPIRIPRVLEPLPEELLDNQMNLIYFHHFLNHTGRIMVPHDCPENPFRSVLPSLAVRNAQLLHLLLAFSASHRAKLLGHPVPDARIASWMADVIPALRAALTNSPASSTADPTDPAALAPLATAIMLASYEIITPSPSGSIRIPWQQHLQVARTMIVSRGGLHHLAHQSPHLGRNKGIFFLSRWFAYLDVLGSLSNRHTRPLLGAYDEDGGGMWLVNRGDEEVYQIDCFFGFSGRCIALLAQVAELVAQCDEERFDPATESAASESSPVIPRLGWQPHPEVRQAAIELRARLVASASMVFQGCMHHPTMENTLLSIDSPADGDHSTAHNHHSCSTPAQSAEIYATNEAFHWAGILHLERRILGHPAAHPDVQVCVGKILHALTKVRRGSTAESCLIFPIFSAGCEAIKIEDRDAFMGRFLGVEGWGMQHVARARSLMQAVWRDDLGRGWECLANGEGEFFGHLG